MEDSKPDDELFTIEDQMWASDSNANTNDEAGQNYEDMTLGDTIEVMDDSPGTDMLNNSDGAAAIASAAAVKAALEATHVSYTDDMEQVDGETGDVDGHNMRTSQQLQMSHTLQLQRPFHATRLDEDVASDPARLVSALTGHQRDGSNKVQLAYPILIGGDHGVVASSSSSSFQGKVLTNMHASQSQSMQQQFQQQSIPVFHGLRTPISPYGNTIIPTGIAYGVLPPQNPQHLQVHQVPHIQSQQFVKQQPQQGEFMAKSLMDELLTSPPISPSQANMVNGMQQHQQRQQHQKQTRSQHDAATALPSANAGTLRSPLPYTQDSHIQRPKLSTSPGSQSSPANPVATGASGPPSTLSSPPQQQSYLKPYHMPVSSVASSSTTSPSLSPNPSLMYKAVSPIPQSAPPMMLSPFTGFQYPGMGVVAEASGIGASSMHDHHFHGFSGDNNGEFRAYAGPFEGMGSVTEAVEAAAASMAAHHRSDSTSSAFSIASQRPNLRWVGSSSSRTAATAAAVAAAAAAAAAAAPTTVISGMPFQPLTIGTMGGGMHGALSAGAVGGGGASGGRIPYMIMHPAVAKLQTSTGSSAGGSSHGRFDRSNSASSVSSAGTSGTSASHSASASSMDLLSIHSVAQDIAGFHRFTDADGGLGMHDDALGASSMCGVGFDFSRHMYDARGYAGFSDDGASSEFSHAAISAVAEAAAAAAAAAAASSSAASSIRRSGGSAGTRGSSIGTGMSTGRNSGIGTGSGTPAASHSSRGTGQSTPNAPIRISIASATVDSFGNHICPYPYCAKPFKTRLKLRSHMKSHRAKTLQCAECGASFNRTHDLRRHQRSLHTVVRPFQCPACMKTFARMDALKRHTLRSTNGCNDVASEDLARIELAATAAAASAAAANSSSASRSHYGSHGYEFNSDDMHDDEDALNPAIEEEPESTEHDSDSFGLDLHPDRGDASSRNRSVSADGGRVRRTHASVIQQ